IHVSPTNLKTPADFGLQGFFHGRLHRRLFRLLHAAERLKCRTMIPRELHFLEPHSLSSGLFAAIDTP
ncbi:MAG: hypothetical protein V4843_06800, partial [Pseudomonadota bacterium]